MPVRTSNLIDHLAPLGTSRTQGQRRLAQFGLGILQALRNSTMTIEEASEELFNPDTYRLVRQRRYAPELLEFMEWGMELEDVLELAPDGLSESYDNMEKLLFKIIAGSRNGRSNR